MTKLEYQLLVTDPIPQHTTQHVPNGDDLTWSPITSTLIHGESEAVLVDPQFTFDQGRQVADWVRSSGKHLSAIYVTHGHGDHWFAAPVILEAFPDAAVVATRGTIDLMARQADPAFRAAFWDRLFPGQIPTDPVDVKEIPSGGISLEGEPLLAVEVGHSDTDATTVLWVPSIRLAVAGDVIYNGVHQYLDESQNGGRDAWRRAIDKVRDLGPAHVVAGHKNRDRDDDPVNITLTRKYLDDVDALLAKDLSSRKLFDEMLKLYPDRLNPGALWAGVVTLLGDA